MYSNRLHLYQNDIIHEYVINISLLFFQLYCNLFFNKGGAIIVEISLSWYKKMYAS